jgi:hypothetical protein
MVLSPPAETPYDAQSLARAELVALSRDLARARAEHRLDLLTQAHLDALRAVAKDAIEARTTVPVQPDVPKEQ